MQSISHEKQKSGRILEAQSSQLLQIIETTYNHDRHSVGSVRIKHLIVLSDTQD